MNASAFRATLVSRFAAVFLGMAAIAAAGTLSITPAEAAVRAVVGRPLQEAQSLAASGNYSAAMAKVHQAEGAGGLTGEENRVIGQMRAYIESKSNATSGKGKLAADYRAGRWSSVIADADSMRGQLDGNDMAAVATAYYKLGDNAQCVRYIKNHFGNGASEIVLEIQRACAFSAGDDEAQTEALELLVARTGKPEYWNQLLKASERTRGLRDHQTLDIYRIKLRTGSIATADEYLTLSKLALALGFPAEAMDVEQRGIAAKVLSGDTIVRLGNMTKAQMATNQATVAARMGAAKAAPSGDALIKMGEDLWGQGKFADAITAIKAGIAKDKTDLNDAQIRLGMAYLGAGQKDEAVRAFAKVKDDPKQELVAHLWTLYARK